MDEAERGPELAHMRLGTAVRMEPARWPLQPSDQSDSRLPIPTIGAPVAALGNVHTFAAAGASLRFGWDLPSDCGPPRVRPSLPGTDFFNPTAGFGWYLFAGAEGRAVAHDIFLDGNTFTDSHSVDREPFVADLQVGLAVTFRALRIALTQVYRTPEFEERDRVQRFTALSLSMRW